MSNIPNDNGDTVVPSGMTLIDTDSDLDTFSLALYSRIHQHTDLVHDIVDPVEENSIIVERQQSSHTLTPANHITEQEQAMSDLPSTTFVSRIRQQLQSTCRTPSTVSLTSTRQTTTSNPKAPTSFLDIAEQRLQDHYDRVLSEDALIEDGVDAFVELDTKQLHEAFQRRYGVCLDDATQTVRQIVQSAVDDYKNYFEIEKDILETAKRYDSLQTWLRHTRDIFETNDLQPTAEQTSDLESKLHDYMTNTPEWKKKFIDATHKWKQLCISRQALRTIHELVGGTTCCRICFNKQVKTLLVPCGHVLCDECANRVSCCPFCNTSFYARQEVYFL